MTFAFAGVVSGRGGKREGGGREDGGEVRRGERGE